jgi:hypothetical protein
MPHIRRVPLLLSIAVLAASGIFPRSAEAEISGLDLECDAGVDSGLQTYLGAGRGGVTIPLK